MHPHAQCINSSVSLSILSGGKGNWKNAHCLFLFITASGNGPSLITNYARDAAEIASHSSCYLPRYQTDTQGTCHTIGEQCSWITRRSVLEVISSVSRKWQLPGNDCSIVGIDASAEEGIMPNNSFDFPTRNRQKKLIT